MTKRCQKSLQVSGEVIKWLHRYLHPTSIFRKSTGHPTTSANLDNLKQFALVFLFLCYNNINNNIFCSRYQGFEPLRGVTILNMKGQEQGISRTQEFKFVR